ncbi:MAG: hypothetical protein V4563_15425 [Pseudomonadota bacterium]
MADTDSNIHENPYLRNIESAPYELGHLLQQLPENFSAFSGQTPTADMQLIAAAAAKHAENANVAVMCGLDAIGKMLFIASQSKDWQINSTQMANIGCLISHLAIEAQFLKDTQGDLEFTLQELAKKSVATA